MRRVGGGMTAVMLVAVLAVTLTTAVAPQATAGASEPARTAIAAKGKRCPAITREFAPKYAKIKGKWYDVVRVGRTASGQMGTPPVSSSGKWKLGWYPSREPGTRAGAVPFNAHTWPNGSALGNTLLRKLRKGNVIWVQGDHHAACYKVTKRATYSRSKAPLKRILGAYGKPRLTIIVCSGRRVGPRNWTHRTVWYAVPYTGRA